MVDIQHFGGVVGRGSLSWEGTEVAVGMFNLEEPSKIER